MLIPLLLGQQADDLSALKGYVNSFSEEVRVFHTRFMAADTLKGEAFDAELSALSSEADRLKTALLGITQYQKLPPLKPPTEVTSSMVRNGPGGELVVKWKLSPDDGTIDGYEIYRALKGDEANALLVATALPKKDSLVDGNDETRGNIEYFRRELQTVKRNLGIAKQVLPSLQNKARTRSKDSDVAPLDENGMNSLAEMVLQYKGRTISQLEYQIGMYEQRKASTQETVDSLKPMMYDSTMSKYKLLKKVAGELQSETGNLSAGIGNLSALEGVYLKTYYDPVVDKIDRIALGLSNSPVANVSGLEAQMQGLDARIAQMKSMIAGLAELKPEDLDVFAQGYIGQMDTLRMENEKLLLKNNTPYVYRAAAVRGEEKAFSEFSNESKPIGYLFNWARLNVLVCMIVFFFLVLFFINQAKRGKELFLRKIAGLDAIDDAVGRATEMGRPILFVPGLSGIGDIATIAALNILQGIAKKAAQYDTPLIVPNRDPIVYTVAREIVKEAYSDVGRPDTFNPDSVFFVTDSQFAFVAAVNGIMLREKPATNFFLGMFWAESLLLSETGNIAGSIQIAGTDAPSQLPFFITSCDYTIIGQELYAASAYISREPNLVGTIKAQDWGQAIMVVIMVVAAIITVFGLEFAINILTTV